MESFGTLMFTEAVKAEQTKAGSRGQMAQAYMSPRFREIGPDEKAFIETRTSAYIGSVNDAGWPYVQHRGGPAGFLKVLGPDSIAFAEYPGNRQFVTIGNLATETRLSVFLMDYARRARLKLLAEAEITEDPDVLGGLDVPQGVKSVRAMLLKVVALDWNCPKYIVPRYTEEEVDQLIGPKMRAMAARIEELEAEIAQLRTTQGET